MTCENARELYSDYSEKALTPAAAAGLEEHFAACAGCREDYEGFRQVARILAEGLPEVDAPAGFRAAVMQRVAESAQKSAPARPESSPAAYRAPREPFSARWGAFLRGLTATPRRAFVAGIACTLIAVAAFSGLHGVRVSPNIVHPTSTGIGQIEAGLLPVPVQHTSGILQNAISQSQDGQTYHYFGIHLPLDSPPAQVSAYVLQNGTGLTDDSALNNIDNATPAWHGTVEQGVSIHIPVAVVSQVAPGTTLNFLVVWSAGGNNQAEEKEAAFVPLSPQPTAPTPINPGDSLYDVLQNISSGYHVKIFVDPTAVSAATQEALIGSSGLNGLTGNEGSARAALQTALSGAGYYITEQSDGSFLVWHA